MGHSGVVFSGLPAQTGVKIYTLTGEQVREIIKNDTNDNLVWDGRNDLGENLASGVYFYIVTNNTGEKKTGKIAVIK